MSKDLLYYGLLVIVFGIVMLWMRVKPLGYFVTAGGIALCMYWVKKKNDSEVVHYESEE